MLVLPFISMHSILRKLLRDLTRRDKFWWFVTLKRHAKLSSHGDRFIHSRDIRQMLTFIHKTHARCVSHYYLIFSVILEDKKRVFVTKIPLPTLQTKCWYITTVNRVEWL